jgi:hypothetical protein
MEMAETTCHELSTNIFIWLKVGIKGIQMRYTHQTITFLRYPELEFLNNLWGLGSEKEKGYRTGPPGYIVWRNRFIGIDSGLHKRIKIRAQAFDFPCNI